MAFNDIRTTLQALSPIYDNCNSLHTNAYDEAVTTPTEESVRRAMAIQLIINREWGLAKNENPNQGSFIIDELTDLVEEAVLKEFDAHRRARRRARRDGDRLSARQDPGRVAVLRAARSMTAAIPIIGVNTFRNPHSEAAPESDRAGALDRRRRSSRQLKRLADFHARHAAEAPAAARAAAPRRDRQRATPSKC